ncbi:hypothetical protein HPB49_026576 [Dermacentor silvarum]|nr:hypothetical protein HPB49_026576 [Dermacentor silvarum]
MTMEVTVEGTEITPEELRTADWITKVGKHVKELQDLARDERRESQNNGERAERCGESGEGKKAAAANAAYRKLGQKIAERSVASHLPRLPANDYKIILRPKNGLGLAKVPTTRLSAAVRMAAQIPWVKGQEKDVMIVNDKQGTLIFSTPDMDTVWKEGEKQQNAGTSGGAVVNNPLRAPSPNRKVGWAGKASQDKRDEEMFQIKEENRMLKEQLAAMSRQIEELKIALKPNTAPVKQPQVSQKPNVEGSEEQMAAPPPAKKRAKEMEKPIIDKDIETVIDIKIAKLEETFETKSSQDDEWRKAFEERMLGMFQNLTQQLHQRDNNLTERLHQRDNKLTEELKAEFAKRDRAYEELTQQVLGSQMNQLVGSHGS